MHADDREFTASGDVNDLDGIRQFSRGLPAPRAGPGPQAFDVKFDNYYLESSLYTSGKGGRDGAAENCGAGKTYEQDGALWLRTTDYGDDKDRVMRKSDGYTYFVPDVAYHITKWERGFQQVVNIQGTDHHGTIARVRRPAAANVGIPAGYPDYVLHTMVRVMRAAKSEDFQARGQLRHAARPGRLDQQGRGALLPAQPQTRHRIRVRRGPGAAQNNDNPVYYVQVRPCAHLLGAGRLGRASQPADADLSPLDNRPGLR